MTRDSRGMGESLPTGEERAWHIVGCGAIGGMIGARLQQAGGLVRVVPRQGESDIRFDYEQDGIHTQVTLPCDSTGPLRRVLLTTKAQQGLEALRALRHRLAPDLVLVVLQNGVGMHEALLQEFAGTLPAMALVAGTTTEGANRPAPGLIRHAGHGETVLGGWRPADETVARAVCQEWTSGSMTIVHDSHIRQRLWNKLIMNCAINPLTALLDCRNGELLDQPDVPALMDIIVREVAAVMLAEGLHVTPDDACLMTRRVAASTRANVSSMCTDYRRGRETEMDCINAAVARAGLARGVPTPVNALLAEAVMRRTPWDAVRLRLASCGWPVAAP